MKRWNGWGDEQTTYPLPENAAEFLNERVGEGNKTADATLESVLANVPTSRLPAHPLINTSAEVRLRHARGHSFPDWLALRSGRIGAFPDGVAFPTTADDVRQLLHFAHTHQFKLIPYGGGTSVVGHINPESGEQPVLTVNLGRLNRLLTLDETSHLATFGAGVAGPDLEAQLRARGFTLGHYPQSFEYSTLGGWVVTRSSGQQSRGFGRIEDMFAGGRLIAPAGELFMPPLPASSAGPDVRQMILGSEGRLGILTEATVRVRPLPSAERFHAIFFPSFEQGQTAVRHMLQANIPLSLVRLSTARETETTLKLAGHERLIGTLEYLLGLRGAAEDKCLLLLGFTGSEGLVSFGRKEALAIAKKQDGVHAGQQFGEQWIKGRFRTPYLRNTLWGEGYAVDTLETAVTWNQVDSALADMENSITTACGETEGERAHIFTHLSHMYTSGCSIYTTYLFRPSADPEETLERWQKMKTAASQAILRHGGTISHQHGVGKDHKPYLAAEKGSLGLAAITDLTERFDPQGVLATGNLVD